jgi:hypothetical protein
LFAGFALTKLIANGKSDVEAGDILDHLACVGEVVRVEMAGVRLPELRRFLAKI